MPETYLALLRAINVGGKNKLPMSVLAELFEAAGCSQVRTYIQSGNVVFRASPAAARSVPGKVAKRIREELGFDAPIVTRSRGEIDEAVRSNPYLAAGATEDSLFMMFLADAPAGSLIETLDPLRSPGDEYQVRGRDVFLRLGNSAAETKLTVAYFDSRLKTVSTCRNWRTTLKLQAMMAEL